MSLRAIVFILVQSKADADGGISSISQVIARLKRHRPIIVTDRKTDRVRRWRSQGIETHIVPQVATGGLSRNPVGVVASYARYARALGTILRKSGARVVHANDPAAFQLALAPAKLSPGVKIALNLRDTLDPDRPPPRSRYRLLFAAADRVLYLSQDMADRWATIAPNARRRSTVTYSIVDPERFEPAPAPTEEPPVVLLSGIIRAKKNQLGFIRNVSPLLAAEGIATWLVGDFDPSRDPYMAECAQAAEPLGGMLQFLGYRTDLPQLFARASAVAVPSRHEGLVRAMIEGMSCARPVVSFDVSSAREILQSQSGGAGEVVDFGDYEVMARALIAYCRNPALALEAGEKGRSTALRLFSAESVVERYEQAYDELAGS